MTDAPSASPARAVARNALLLVLAALGLSLVMVDTDPDLWGRMAYARDWVATGGIAPRFDPYSYTAPGAPWIDHEWGFNWAAWLSYRALGWPGLRLLRLLLFALTLTLCFRDDPPEEAASPLRPVRGLLIGLPLALGFVGPRAQAFTFLLTAWMLSCLRRSRAGGPKWIVLGVAPMPLWLNLHGGFLAGLGIAGLWGAARFVEALRDRDRRTALALVGAGALCVASLPLSPWGLRFVPFMLRTSTMPRPFVYEWDPPAFLGPHWFMAMLLLAFAAYRIARGQQRRWPELLVLAAVAVLAFQHQRHLSFLALGVAFCAPASLRGQRPVAPDAPGLLWVGRGVGAGALAVAALAAVRLFDKPPAEPAFPARAVAYARAQGISGGALVDFEWSQYVLFQAWPQLKVAFDGRYEEVYPDEVAARYFAWHYGREGWQKLPEDPATRLALVRSGSSREARLKALPGWTRAYEDGVAALYVKTRP